MATSPRPTGLAGLRGPDGTPAFNNGSFVAVFRLLPWVERRLDALPVPIPSAANPATANVPTRPIVRTIAMELRTPPSDVDALVALLPDAFDFASGVTSDEDRAAYLGLTWDGSTFGNGPQPMTDLLQPGQLFQGSGTAQELLQFPTSTSVQMWAFDHRGRPLDPGAVAAWWNLQAGTTFTNLWADGVAERTVQVANGLTFHLVNAHEGPLDAPMSRLQLTNATGSGVVQRASNNNGVTVAFTNAPNLDDFPQPLAAVLPDGRYTNQAQAWQNGALANLARDFVRIGVLSVEHDLVGQRRTAAAGAADVVQRRADDQNRASTGVRPARSTRNALLAGGEATLGALATPAGGTIATVLVASQVDRDAGQLPVPTLAAGTPPQTAPSLTAVALDGGGVADGSIALGQTVLVTAQFADERVGCVGAHLAARVRSGDRPAHPARRRCGTCRPVRRRAHRAAIAGRHGCGLIRRGCRTTTRCRSADRDAGRPDALPRPAHRPAVPRDNECTDRAQLGNSAAAHLRNRSTASGRSPEWQCALRLRGRRTRRDTPATR